MYSPDFTVANKTFCLSHHNSDDSHYLLMAKKSLNLKPKNKV